MEKDDRVLLVLDGCSGAAAYQNFQRWNNAVERYEKRWFAPLLKALLTRRLQVLELFPLDGYRYRLGLRQAWRVWKRTRSYRDVFACENAA